MPKEQYSPGELADRLEEWLERAVDKPDAAADADPLEFVALIGVVERFAVLLELDKADRAAWGLRKLARRTRLEVCWACERGRAWRTPPHSPRPGQSRQDVTEKAFVAFEKTQAEAYEHVTRLCGKLRGIEEALTARPLAEGGGAPATAVEASSTAGAEDENRCTPMPKIKLARRLLNDPDARPRKAEAMMNRHGLRREGGNLWTVRLGELSPKVVERLMMKSWPPPTKIEPK